MVKKRETFYLAGYDPRGARHYYNLYKKEGILQSKINNMKMDISSRKYTDKYIQSWTIKSTTNEKMTETNYHFLVWDDIIRKNWSMGVIPIILDILYYFKVYILSGSFIYYSRMFPRHSISIFFPVLYLLLSIILSFILSIKIVDFLHINPLILSQLLIIIIAIVLVYFFILLAEKLSLFWMLRIFVFTGSYVFENQKKLEERLDIFATYILNIIDNAKKDEIDEILIVSHSVGSILLIPLLEKILKNTTYPLKNISILSLGECIPLVSGIDKSVQFKSQMQYISKQENIYWIDYTSAIDFACFPYLNYFQDSNIQIKRTENFHFLSPRFHTLYSKKHYQKIRKNIYLAHFLYLMSTENEGTYDFFKMTAGHQYLCDRLKK